MAGHNDELGHRLRGLFEAVPIDRVDQESRAATTGRGLAAQLPPTDETGCPERFRSKLPPHTQLQLSGCHNIHFAIARYFASAHWEDPPSEADQHMSAAW